MIPSSDLPSPLPTDRQELLSRLGELGDVDLIVIGGGASGLGVALDARLRGLSVLLLESHDFAGGTSSRATKLVHGGVRYLAQGNVSLVREALHERKALLANAPHLAQPLGFVMPAYKKWQLPFYGLGLKVYDALAGAASLGATQWLSRQETLQQLPGANPDHLSGGIKYWDGQFDDARLALALARTAAAQGALLLNYCPVVEILHENGQVCGVRWQDALDGAGLRTGRVRARCVINATGVWVDEVRHLDEMARGRVGTPMVAPSQGVHLVVDRSFLPGSEALLVPHTRDGRVLFAVPWLGHLILGTTDTARVQVEREPQAQPDEVHFILTESARVLARAPKSQDVLSIWAGLRPLVRPDGGASATRRISREHDIRISPTRLVTVTGGKWTTYRAMAEDVLQYCVHHGLLPHLPPCQTARFALVGAPGKRQPAVSLAQAPGLHLYGSEAPYVQTLPGNDIDVAMGLTQAMVRYAVRHEYARTVEDVLARRHRMVFLNAHIAQEVAPQVSDIIQEETGTDGALESFIQLARQYAQVPQ